MAIFKKEIVETREFFAKPEGAIKHQRYNLNISFLGISICSRPYRYDAKIIGNTSSGAGFKTD